MCCLSMVVAFNGGVFQANVITCLVVFGVFKIDRLYVGVSSMQIKFEEFTRGWCQVKRGVRF